jgi:uncharacterized protein
MSTAVVAIILATTLITAAISGVFGMAGGLLLMGVLASFTPVATAMVVHGFIQLISNGSRAILHRRYLAWSIIGRYAVGIVGAMILIALIPWRPDQPTVFLLLGCTAMLVWIPKSWVDIDATRRFQSEICGFLVQTLNTLAGVAGPLLDLFFVKTDLPRQTVVATKAATQVMAHAVKIGFWGVPLLTALTTTDAHAHAMFPPLWAFALIIPLSLLGTWLGSLVLARMTDANFRTWTKWIVTVTGAVYLAQAATLLSAP